MRRFTFPKTASLTLSLAVSLALLPGCDGLFTAPNPGGETTGQQEQETPDVKDETKPTTTYMYVMNTVGKTIDEINLKTMEVTRDVMTTGLFPNQMVTQGVITWMVNSGDHEVVKLDLRARKKVDAIALANGTNPTTITAYGEGKAFVANLYTSDLIFVDLASKATEPSVALPKGAAMFEPAVVSGKAYVPADKWTDDWTALEFSGIHVVDLETRTVVKTIDLNADANPTNVSVDPSGNVWVGVEGGLVKIDAATDTVAATLDFGEKVHWVRYVSATKAYGTVLGGLISFNPTTGEILRDVAHKIPVDTAYGAFKIFKGVGYVSSQSNDTVSVVDLVTETASGSPIPVGDGPLDLTFVTVQD